MSSDAIPDDVRKFIRENMRTLMTLELLLLLQADPARDWTAQELARDLRTDAGWAGRELQELARRGLVAASEADPAKFHYAPRRTDLDAVVTKLAAAYPDRRFSIIQIMYAPTSEPIQSFADAFKLRKDPSDG